MIVTEIFCDKGNTLQEVLEAILPDMVREEIERKTDLKTDESTQVISCQKKKKTPIYGII